jgi:hypothetical protein
MKTVAFMREFVAAYVKSQTLIYTGQEILCNYFKIPFSIIDGAYVVNGVYMDEEEFKTYVIDFFQEMDTVAVIELYHKITV